MPLELWPHQTGAVNATLLARKEGRPAGLWVMPTGCGKTLAFCSLARQLDLPTLVVVHRRELVAQSEAAFAQAWPEAAVARLSEEGWERATVVVATVQALANRLKQIDRRRFDLVVIDEAHHAVAATWQRVIGHFRPRLLLGCTATPERLDGQDLLPLFGDNLLYEYGLEEAIGDGYLVPVWQQAIKTSTSLAGVTVSKSKGDFVARSLAKHVGSEARAREVVEGYLTHGEGRPAVFFAVDLAHVELLRRELVRAGVRAASVTGGMATADRDNTLEAFSRGDLQALVNCEVLTEGYDEKRISCIVMARPTMSQALYQQCVGRGLRLAREHGKEDCLVLDVLDQSAGQRPVVASELFGARVEDCQGRDVREAAKEERERWSVCPLRPTAGLEARWADGRDIRWGQLPDLRGYAPTARWHDDPATEGQEKALGRFGFEPLCELTKGEADHLIRRCRALGRQYPTPATSAQRFTLKRVGLWKEGMTKWEAGARLARHFATGR
jgi:superfamily II DNA or RNA helicase